MQVRGEWEPDGPGPALLRDRCRALLRPQDGLMHVWRARNPEAVALAPNANIIKVLLGQALVATDKPGVANEVINLLTVALQAEPELSIGYRALARAYALNNDIPMAQLATAQGLLIELTVQFFPQ